MEPLSQEELAEIRDFFAGTGKRMLEQLQAATVAAWMVAQDVTEREQQWHRLQAVYHLESLLRDTKTMNDMTRRRLEQRAANRL